MSTLRNKRLMLKVCELYYIQGKSQKEISVLLGISRPQVCRLITAAKESGAVTITIANPYIREAELEKRIIEKYSISDVWVIDSLHDGKEGELYEFAKEAGRLIEDYLPQDSRVGVMSGRTGKAVIDAMTPSNKKLKLVVPLIGGVSTTNMSVHADTLAQKLASLHSSSARNLNAPAVVSTQSLAESLKEEESIARVLKEGSKVDIALVGIGTIDCSATNVRLGCVNEKDMEELKMAGAVASICTSYLDREGKEVGNSLSRRSIGVSLEELKRSRVIAVAIGEKKVEAITAVLKSGKVDVLITDFSTAKKVLEE